MFYCCNPDLHQPQVHHLPNGECKRPVCKWKIHEHNYDEKALVKVAKMKRYTPSKDPPYVTLDGYVALRDSRLHFKKELAKDYLK